MPTPRSGTLTCLTSAPSVRFFTTQALRARSTVRSMSDGGSAACSARPAAVHGHRLREREELAPPDARRHAYLDAVRAGHDRARRARRHDPGDRLLRPVLRGVDGRGRPLDQAEAAGARAAAEATPDEQQQQ